MNNFFELVRSKKGKERKAFKKKILKATGAANPTWYTWVNTENVSTPFQKLISIELNQSIETLFPEK